MKALCKFLFCAGAFCALTIGAYFGFFANIVDDLVEDQLRARELESELARAYGVVETRNHIVNRLLGGEIDLLVAASQFRELSLQLPTFDWENFRDQFPGDTEEECFCRHVITYVAANGRFGNAQAAAAVDRLNTDLQNYMSSR